MTGDMIVWLTLLIVFLGAELFTVALVSVWFSVGAAAALAGAYFGASPFVQACIFVLVSAASLLATRPLIKRMQSKQVRTNADRNIGEPGIVTEDIDNLAGKGAVRIDGKEWTARADKGEKIPAGTTVIILRIEGVKLIVSPSEVAAPVNT